MPQLPSPSRQARLARGTIRIALWGALIAYGISVAPPELRARVVEKFNHFFQGDIQSAPKGRPP